MVLRQSPSASASVLACLSASIQTSQIIVAGPGACPLTANHYLLRIVRGPVSLMSASTARARF